MFSSIDKSSGQCSGPLSPDIGFGSPLITNMVNGKLFPLCGMPEGIHIGTNGINGSVEITFPHPISYFEFDFCALSGGAGTFSEHLEVWVDGVFYDLTTATVGFSSNNSYITNSGNLGRSGKSGVIEPKIDGASGTITISFSCKVNVLEIKNIHDIPDAAGSIIQVRYCTTPSTLGSCLCSDRQLVISKTKIADCPTNILASVKVFNPGSDVLPSGTPITFYDGDPTLAGATPIMTYTNTPAIPANGIQNIADIDIGVCDLNTIHLFAILGDDGSNSIPLDLSTQLSGTAYTECDFINNISGFKLKERCSQFGEIINK